MKLSDSRTIDLRRLLALTVATALVGAGAAHVAADALANAAPRTFADLLVDTAAIMLVVAVAWWALLVVAVLAEALSGGRLRVSTYAAPAAWRRAVLGLCGAAVIISAGSAAQASGDHGSAEPNGLIELDGVQLPERAVGDRPTPPRSPDAPGSLVTVRAGDSLWSVATGLLPRSASPERVAALTQRLYEANRTVVGPDPDLIRPGMQLRAPTPQEER